MSPNVLPVCDDGVSIGERHCAWAEWAHASAANGRRGSLRPMSVNSAVSCSRDLRARLDGETCLLIQYYFLRAFFSSSSLLPLFFLSRLQLTFPAYDVCDRIGGRKCAWMERAYASEMKAEEGAKGDWWAWAVLLSDVWTRSSLPSSHF